MKNVAVLTEFGAFALVFRPHPILRQKKNADSQGSARWGEGGLGAGGID